MGGSAQEDAEPASRQPEPAARETVQYRDPRFPPGSQPVVPEARDTAAPSVTAGNTEQERGAEQERGVEQGKRRGAGKRRGGRKHKQAVSPAAALSPRLPEDARLWLAQAMAWAPAAVHRRVLAFADTSSCKRWLMQVFEEQECAMPIGDPSAGGPLRRLWWRARVFFMNHRLHRPLLAMMAMGHG